MLDTCTVQHQTGQALDSNDVMVPTFVTVYTGQCRVKAFRTGHQTEAGQVAILMRGYDIQLPWDASGPVLRADILTITASDDTWLIGRPLTVTEVEYSGTQTARHIKVEDDS
jgi:hypothetical protein